jgi:uncharacterized protein (TIRG00374 family)
MHVPETRRPGVITKSKRGKSIEFSARCDVMLMKMKKIFRYAILFLVIIGVLLAVSNFQKFRQNIREIVVLYLFVAMASALLVHFFEGLFLRTTLRVFDENLSLPLALQSSLIINSIGYFVSLGGLTPFATQVHILDSYGINVKKATVTRILHLFLFNAIFDIMLIAGFVSILVDPVSRGPYATAILGVTGFFIAIHPFLYVVLFWVPFRRVAITVLFRVLNRVIGLFSRRFSLDPQPVVSLFDEFQEGVRDLTKRPLRMGLLLLVTLGVYLFWIGVMYFSFLSLNYRISPGTLALGFATAQIVGVLSMIPGGIGTMEGSGSLAYAALGVPIETALTAMLGFRMIYYVFPFILSLPFYFTLKYRKRERG